MRLGLASLIALAALSLAPAAALGMGFFGVTPQAELSAGDYQRLRGLGVAVRLPINWSQVEPEPGHYDFTVPDRQIGVAAAHGVRVLPFFYGTPAWLSAESARPPLGARGLRGWRAFVRAAVRRYGPGGSFWSRGGKARPIRVWQIWNEPNFRLFWRARISARAYARLLRASAGAIRGVDRKALIVAAGVAPIERSIQPWEFLRRLYRVPGARRSFDIAALHPYSSTIAGVEYEVRRTRRVMAQAGAGHQPLLISEVGVSSHSLHATAYDRGRWGQARFLNRLYKRLLARRRRWRLAGAYWFTWQDANRWDPVCSFCQGAGLFDVNGEAKPAWQAFRRAVKSAARPSVR